MSELPGHIRKYISTTSEGTSQLARRHDLSRSSPSGDAGFGDKPLERPGRRSPTLLLPPHAAWSTGLATATPSVDRLHPRDQRLAHSVTRNRDTAGHRQAALPDTWRPPTGGNSATDRARDVKPARVNQCPPHSTRLDRAMIHCSAMYQIRTDGSRVTATRRGVVVHKEGYIVVQCIRQMRTTGHTKTLIGKYLGSGPCSCRPQPARELTGPVEVYYVSRGRLYRSPRAVNGSGNNSAVSGPPSRAVNALLNPPSRHLPNR
jgi:hypothetical protein